MERNINRIGILALVVIFVLFYFVTTLLLDKRNLNTSKIDNTKVEETSSLNYEDEKAIINNLYKDAKILYDVVNNKFTVSSEDIFETDGIIYKKITNFSDVMNSLFTEEGSKKYVSDLGKYFAHTDDSYYLAGNLVDYQTYYFRGDNTNIYVTSGNESEINGIIYERWTSNNKNTLATIKVVNNEGKWLIDDISILSADIG